MTAERSKTPMIEDLVYFDFCLLDYRNEELGSIFHSEELRKIIKKSGPQGETFLSGLGNFLETQNESGIHAANDISDETELRSLFTYKLPFGTIKRMIVYLEGLMTAQLKQEHNV